MPNPAELDKSLFAGIIYTKRVDNSATVTKRIELIAPFVPIFFFTSFFRLSCFLVCIASFAVFWLVIAFKTIFDIFFSN
jgi:hypothetical protein